MVHPVISTGLSRGGILYVVCKVNLISLIDFTTDGGCMKDIICYCLALSTNSKTIERLQSDNIAVKEYASDLQTFLGSKAIEEDVKKEEENIMLLSEDGCLQQLTFNAID
jgi:hypothetical protein